VRKHVAVRIDIEKWRFGSMDVLNTAIVLSHHPGWGDGGSDWWWVWRIGMLLFWLVVIALVIFWARRWGPRREPSGIERARDILAERYARGEISGEEYRERLAQLPPA
jgi:putative membrane protein